MPTPDWARCHVEIYETPGFHDDCFRSSLWTLFQSAASQSFTPDSGVSGDLAVMAVTEGATPSGCGYRKDISSLNLNTDTYPRLRIRLRGRSTTPQYKIGVEYTDASSNETGWIDAPTDMTVDVLELLSGKTIKYVMLYARCSTAYGTAYVDWDYAVVLKNPPLVPTEALEVGVDLSTTTRVSGLRLKILNDVLLGVTARRYSLDEGEGVKAYDLSRNKGHAKLINTSWSTGKHGKCLYFNGTNARMETGYKTIIPADGALTICFWLKAAPGATGVICGFGKDVGAGFNRVQFNFSGNQLRLYVKDDAGNIRQYTTQSIVCQSQWLLVTGIIDPSGDKTEVWIDDYYDGGASGTLGQITLDAYDLTWGCLHNESGYLNYSEEYVDEPMVFTRALKEEEILRILKREPPSGAARSSCGNIVMVYLSAYNESLIRKIITARVIDRLTSGEPDEPTLELVCEDLGEIMHERTFTEEYATATQISEIVDDIMDQLQTGIFHQVDATSRAIKNVFKDEGAFSLLQKLAETAKFSTGETGANFYVDPGGALRFKRYGAFSSPCSITDGSDGNPANIQDIKVRETMKGDPRLVNDAKVIIFEEEAVPKDEDSWTESADSWSSPDPTDANYPQSETGDVKSGTASIKFQTTNPGSQYRIRHIFNEVDLTDLDKVNFWIKYGVGLSPENLEIKIQKGAWIWTWDYRTYPGLSPPAAGTWGEITAYISEMMKTGNPGKIVDHFQIRLYRSEGDLGVGGVLIDKLRFIRNEKYGSHSDSSSQADYGKRTHREVDKNVTDVDYAGYLAENIVEHRKNPLVLVSAVVKGRAQTGFRPPDMIQVTSLKDELDQKTFQIQRARHVHTPEEGYTCELELVAARKPDGTYEPKVAPVTFDLEGALALLRRKRAEAELYTVRTNWI